MTYRHALNRFIWPALLAASPTHAQQGPEQLDQIEVQAGEVQAEYYASFGGAGSRDVEMLVGIDDRVAIGIGAEFEGPRRGLSLETVSLAALFRTADPAVHSVGFGIKVQAALDRDGHFAGAEARAIVERRRHGWWLQGDLIILRHTPDDGAQGTDLAYAASAQRALGDRAWLGIEVSGHLARLSAERAPAAQGGHYIGPAAAIELPVGKAEVEVGLAWLQRLRGDGPNSGPRLFAQFTF